MAYLSRVKSNNNIYIYLTIYDPECKHSSKKERNIYSFGRLDKAIEKMNMWMLIPSLFPEELAKLGFTIKNVEKWISSIKGKNEKNVKGVTANIIPMINNLSA